MIKLIVSGRVGNDAELKTVGDTTVCTFSVAHSEKVYGPTPSEKVIWISCNIWGERGPKLQPHITKGTFVVVEGSGTVNSYMQKNGEPAAILNCRVATLEFGGKSNASAESSSITSTGNEQLLNNPAVQELKTKLNFDEELPF
jgi:single-strand DNA-binding protein